MPQVVGGPGQSPTQRDKDIPAGALGHPASRRGGCEAERRGGLGPRGALPSLPNDPRGHVSRRSSLSLGTERGCAEPPGHGRAPPPCTDERPPAHGSGLLRPLGLLAAPHSCRQINHLPRRRVGCGRVLTRGSFPEACVRGFPAGPAGTPQTPSS